ncbi:uncharacterized protein CEXT_421701 [Caerostris extrusa]|uniref:Uncharacterized protein n=1 Tax=Caerostris extrusa TaxID=172846 RepID=A0AAV4WXI1_CAEEX|nr:uncharacterized protein CEXT_421701 [Caerostris extrusa]
MTQINEFEFEECGVFGGSIRVTVGWRPGGVRRRQAEEMSPRPGGRARQADEGFRGHTPAIGTEMQAVGGGPELRGAAGDPLPYPNRNGDLINRVWNYMQDNCDAFGGWWSYDCFHLEDTKKCEKIFALRDAKTSKASCREFDRFRHCISDVVQKRCQPDDVSSMGNYLLDSAGTWCGPAPAHRTLQVPHCGRGIRGGGQEGPGGGGGIPAPPSTPLRRPTAAGPQVRAARRNSGRGVLPEQSVQLRPHGRFALCHGVQRAGERGDEGLPGQAPVREGPGAGGERRRGSSAEGVLRHLELPPVSTERSPDPLLRHPRNRHPISNRRHPRQPGLPLQEPLDLHLLGGATPPQRSLRPPADVTGRHHDVSNSRPQIAVTHTEPSISVHIFIVLYLSYLENSYVLVFL